MNSRRPSVHRRGDRGRGTGRVEGLERVEVEVGDVPCPATIAESTERCSSVGPPSTSMTPTSIRTTGSTAVSSIAAMAADATPPGGSR